jgi:hypothetical protein
MFTFFLTLTHCAVVKINTEDKTDQGIFKRIGKYATDYHVYHIRIPVNLEKIINMPMKAMNTVE